VSFSGLTKARFQVARQRAGESPFREQFDFVTMELKSARALREKFMRSAMEKAASAAIRKDTPKWGAMGAGCGSGGDLAHEVEHLAGDLLAALVVGGGFLGGGVGDFVGHVGDGDPEGLPLTSGQLLSALSQVMRATKFWVGLPSMGI
jgi:hypothetical protein